MSAPQPDVASPSPKKPMNRKRVLTVVGIGALALALVATVSFGAMSLFAPGGPFGGPVQLKVTGQPMSTAGHWANGVKETWRVPVVHDRPTESEEVTFMDSGPSTRRSWALSGYLGDTASELIGIDPANGKTRWVGTEASICAEEEINGLLPCLAFHRTASKDFEAHLALFDWVTGKSRVSTTLAALKLPADFNVEASVVVAEGDILVTIPRYPNQAGESLGPLAGVTVARVSGDTRTVRWAHTEKGCDSTWDGDSTVPSVRHGVYFAAYGMALDFGRGTPVFGANQCAFSEADNVAYTPGGTSTKSVQAPDGSTLFGVSTSAGFLLGGPPPPLPLRLEHVVASHGSAEESTTTGTADLMAYNPATGQPRWAKPVHVAVEPKDDGTFVGETSYVNGLLFYRGAGTLVAIDPLSGTQRWSRGDVDMWEPDYALAADGVVLVSGTSNTVAVSAATGAELWNVPGFVHSVLSPGGGTSLLDVVDFGNGHVVRLDPTDRPTRALSVPSGTPACPAGMTPISWTQYSDGAILLCQAADRFAVVYPTHPDWQAAQLNFTDGGHQVVFSNGVKIRVGLGGSVVYTDANGTTTSRPATTSWNNAQGQVKFALPSNIKTCPAGSWPISLSTYKGGWLQVCGVSSNQPTVIYLADGANIIEAGSVTARNGGYCGVAPIGQVCAFEAPAVVSISQNGKVTQHSASANYFDGRGAGGAGIGTGSYGVTAPSSTAKDQVRYLTQILQKSAAGRANLETAVNQVRTCTDLPGAVATMNGVVANRQQLLDALDSTPVDAIPNGAALVAQLRDALQKSHDSDLLWVKWAQAEQGNGCSDGENNPSFKQVDATLEAVASAKDIFVANWNSSIAPTYGVSKFTTSQI